MANEQGRTSGQEEVAIISAIYDQLRQLDYRAQLRVLNWVSERIADDRYAESREQLANEKEEWDHEAAFFNDEIGPF